MDLIVAEHEESPATITEWLIEALQAAIVPSSHAGRPPLSMNRTEIFLA
jgi:hypothetical protein